MGKCRLNLFNLPNQFAHPGHAPTPQRRLHYRMPASAHQYWSEPQTMPVVALYRKNRTLPKTIEITLCNKLMIGRPSDATVAEGISNASSSPSQLLSLKFFWLFPCLVIWKLEVWVESPSAQEWEVIFEAETFESRKMEWKINGI